MVRQKVADYIRSLLQKGYDVSTIRNTMLKYGYSNQDIDEAINAIYNPTIRHEIHLSKATIFVIIFVAASLIGAGAFFYFSPGKTPSQLLDLKLEPVKAEVQAGDSVVFIKDMTSLGSSKRYDTVVTEEIIDATTFKIISQNTETIAIETSSSTQTRLQIPKDTKPGDYLLRVTADYNNQKAFAKLPIKILPSANKESCFDGIKNQNEAGVDCGGACKPCENETPKIDCNDNNPCTNDVVENGKCANKPIDCKKEVAPASPETIDGIKELAKSYPDKALKQCSDIEIPILKDTCIGNIGEVQRNKNYCLKIIDSETKDTCYRKVAELTNDNAICEEIKNAGIKDSCYMTFVLDNHDYSVCGKITMKVQRDSCESLKQIYKNINK